MRRVLIWAGVLLATAAQAGVRCELRDVAAGGSYVAASEAGTLGFDLSVKETRRGNARVFTLEAVSKEWRDRAMTVRGVVGLSGSSLSWQRMLGEDIAFSRTDDRTLQETRDRAVGTDGLSPWPLGAVSADGQGVAVGVDPEWPSVYRIAADTQARGLAVHFDLGFAVESPTATVRFVVFPYEAKDGFRGAFEAYQALYPEAFSGRAKEHGQWMPFARISAVREWEDFGFKFKEGVNETDWDDAHGIVTLHYTEPCTWWMWALRPDGRGHASFSNCVALARQKASAGDPEAAAWQEAAIRDADGNIVGLCRDTPWCTGVVWAVNSAPCIRGNPNYFDLRAKWMEKSCAGEAASGKGIDGWYVDSAELYVTPMFDFNRAHFAGMRTPLSFENGSWKVGVFKGMIACEFVREVVRRMHACGRLAMANGVPGRWSWLAPGLDVLGTETSCIEGDRWEPKDAAYLVYRRALSGSRPFCFLMNSDFSKIGADKVAEYMRRSVAYGIFPGFFSADAATGHYFSSPNLYERDRPLFKKWVPLCRRLSEAGWRPVNRLVRCSERTLVCEQFGESLSTVFNDTASARCVTLELDGPMRDLVTNRRFVPVSGKVVLELAATELLVLEREGR